MNASGFHDRGKVLTQSMLMLAGGGEACAHIEYLRSQAALFGSVASDSTLYRKFRGSARRFSMGYGKPWRRHGRRFGVGTTV